MCQVPDLASLRRSDVLWVLGVVQRSQRGIVGDAEDEEDGGGGFFRAAVHVAAGSRLEAALGESRQLTATAACVFYVCSHS